MSTKSEKYRILLSRIAAAAGFFLFCVTRSYWETSNEKFTLALSFLGTFLVAISALGRLWCSLYIAGYKDNRLVTEGPYSISRNPLYLFSAIGAVGIGCATDTFTFPLALIVLFTLYYPLVIKSEEVRLRQLYGAKYEEYMKRVPTFFPKFSAFHEPEDYTVKPIVFRRHIFSAVWFIWIIGIIELIQRLRQAGLWSAQWPLY
ncbi:MAG: isoprenylcysteine carboxylmethyltransferase family protein [Deltaproteobacteria bacterium]|nr:isoprenylcysteine carboxylmethyltransferase family protein [Deltaproteobacteria bacterium]